MSKDIKIAIIGAGVSGLSAAHHLRKIGYEDMTVFERESYVGGKVLSYEYEGNWHDLGAIIIGDKRNYKNYHELLSAYDIPSETFATPEVAYMDGHRCSFEQFLKAHYSFIRTLRAFFKMLYLGIRFKKCLKSGFVEAKPELYVNFRDFMHKYKIEPVADTLCPFLIGCGYGYYEEIPAIYIFRFLWLFFRNSLRFKNLVKIMRGESGSGISGCKNGCQELWIKMAEDFQVETSAEIESIRRRVVDSESDKDSKIEIVVNGETRLFDRLIISSPLDEAVQFLDVSDEERELFAKITNTDYYVTLFKGEGFSKSLFIRDHIHPETKGKTVAIFCKHCDSNVYTGYQICPSDTQPNELVEILKNDVERLGGRFDGVITQKYWRYFPRVGTEDLRDGFYKRLDAMQGERGTYYIGAVLNFETLENTVSFAKRLVKKYFT
jgi:oxygen-dependent protoporphyrinogen oxidase